MKRGGQSFKPSSSDRVLLTAAGRAALERHDAVMTAALEAAERLLWPLSSEVVDGVRTVHADSRGDAWRKVVAALDNLRSAS